MKSNYDLAIAYRVYPGNLKNPALIHSDDKFMLVKVCLESLRISLSGLKFKMFVILDSCPLKYKEVFQEFFDEESLIFFEGESLGNPQTFKIQLNWLATQTYSQISFFAEDDYVYKPDTISQMIGFFAANKNVDFLTPYDHPDYYDLSIHNLRLGSMKYGEHKWNRRISTTCTFMARKNNLKKSLNTFSKYDYLGDLGVWILLSINLKHFFKILFYSLWSGYSIDIRIVLFKVLILEFPALIFTKKHTLYSPVPSLATHAEKKYLAPNVNWFKYIRKS